MKRTTVTLTDELASRLQLEAERRKTSFSEVVRILVAEALGVSPGGKRRIAFAALFDDPAMVHADQIDRELETEWPSELDHDRRLVNRITTDPRIFGGKPIIRGRRLAVAHVLSMLAAGDSFETILEGYPWLEKEDLLACLVYAKRLVAHERVKPVPVGTAS